LRTRRDFLRDAGVAAAATVVSPAAYGQAADFYRGNTIRMLIGASAGCGYDIRATPDRCPECGKVPRKIPAI